MMSLFANVFSKIGELLGGPTPWDAERETIDENGNVQVSRDRTPPGTVLMGMEEWSMDDHRRILGVLQPDGTLVTRGLVSIPVSGVSSITYASYGGGGNGNPDFRQGGAPAEPYWQTVGSLPAPERKPVEKKPPVPIKVGERYLDV